MRACRIQERRPAAFATRATYMARALPVTDARVSLVRGILSGVTFARIDLYEDNNKTRLPEGNEMEGCAKVQRRWIFLLYHSGRRVR